jgi:U-box domain
MQDPVTLFPSGLTFDKKSICLWLSKHPNQDPVTQILYDKHTLMFADNIALRQILMQVHGDEAYVKYDDTIFRTQYLEAQYQLGIQYRDGVDGDELQNDVTAVKWFRHAAEQGHARAREQYAEMSSYVADVL